MTPLLTDEQITLYYANYYKEEYFSSRVAIEPWYAPLIPYFSDKNGEYYQLRLRFYRRFFDMQDRHKGGTIADFGGGDSWITRQVFPESLVVTLDEDYERSGGDQRLVLGSASLLTAMHVFEHIPKPFEKLQLLVSSLRRGAEVYIEVPTEYGQLSIRDSFLQCKKIYEESGSVVANALVLLHEHLAHFSKKSLSVLMSRAGVTPIEFYIDGSFIGALGRKM